MEINDDDLLRLKANADQRARERIETNVAKGNLVRHLTYAVGILAGGLIYMTTWVSDNNHAIDTLKTHHEEDRIYIRDLWKETFKQPLPPPSK